MSEYQSFSCTAMGYSHEKRGTVCQDSSAALDGEWIHLAIVSDGHGQKSSFRSDVGSALAVEIAGERLQSFAQFLREQAPDYCIAIHHNYAHNPEQHGFETGFFTPVSQRATQLIQLATKEANLYRHTEFYWHYYYVSRQSCCINVLTECGYMSNRADMDDMATKEITDAKVKALCQGIVDYYLELTELYS